MVDFSHPTLSLKVLCLTPTWILITTNLLFYSGYEHFMYAFFPVRFFQLHFLAQCRVPILNFSQTLDIKWITYTDPFSSIFQYLQHLTYYKELGPIEQRHPSVECSSHESFQCQAKTFIFSRLCFEFSACRPKTY